jgi:hypothetical protein
VCLAPRDQLLARSLRDDVSWASGDAVDWDRVVFHLDNGLQGEIDGPHGDGPSIWWWATGWIPISWPESERVF